MCFWLSTSLFPILHAFHAQAKLEMSNLKEEFKAFIEDEAAASCAAHQRLQCDRFSVYMYLIQSRVKKKYNVCVVLCCVCSVVHSDRTCVFSILDQQGCGLSLPHWYGLIVGWCLCACVPAGLPAWLASCLPCFPPACSPACPHVSMPACLLACLLACLPACLPALPACLPACAPACSSLCLAFRFPLCLIKRLPVRLLACPSPCLVCLSFLVSRGAVVHRSPRCWVLGLPLLCRFLL